MIPGKLLSRPLLHLILLSLALLWLTPILGLLITSIRPPAEISASGWWTLFGKLLDPEQITLASYREVLRNQGLGRAFLNSLAISAPAALVSTLIAALAAYAFAWMSFGGRRALLMLVIGLMVVPLQMTFIPILPIYGRLGLSGTFPGIWLAHTGYGLPLSTYLMYGFIAHIPRELFEAALIDGASAPRMFIRIVLPVSLPALASIFIFQFLWIWNDLLVALIYLGATPRVAPLTLAVTNLVTNRGQNWELLTAAAFISMGLPLLVFFTLQRFVVRGILAGALKG
ncbi:MAG: carbohydrate ABC transporter permease [Desulfobacterales bacterium]